MHIDSPFRQISSFLGRRVVDQRTSAHNPHLEVAEVNGRRILDSSTVNYSFGSLHRVFEEAFGSVEWEGRSIQRALLLGLGAGSVLSLVDRCVAAPLLWTAVEIDGVVVDLARRHFGLDRRSDLRVAVEDAATFLHGTSERYDLIVVDVFIDDRIPPSVESDMFLGDLRRALAHDGLLLFNRLAHTEETRAATADASARFRAVFPGSRDLAIRQNVVLVFDGRTSRQAGVGAGYARAP